MPPSNTIFTATETLALECLSVYILFDQSIPLSKSIDCEHINALVVIDGLSTFWHLSICSALGYLTGQVRSSLKMKKASSRFPKTSSHIVLHKWGMCFVYCPYSFRFSESNFAGWNGYVRKRFTWIVWDRNSVHSSWTEFGSRPVKFSYYRTVSHQRMHVASELPFQDMSQSRCYSEMISLQLGEGKNGILASRFLWRCGFQVRKSMCQENLHTISFSTSAWWVLQQLLAAVWHL